MQALLLGLTLIALTACAPALEWYRADGDYARFGADRYTCLREATYTGGFTLPLLSPQGRMIGATSLPTPEVNTQLFTTCMELRGYTLRPRAS